MLAIIGVLALSVLFTGLAIMFLGEWDFGELGDRLGAFSRFLAAIGYIIFLIMVMFAIMVNIGVKGNIAANQKLYDSLVFQLENNLYDNDNDIGKLELYEKVTEWNTDLARGKALQYDLWIGVFFPNIYDNFDFIELPRATKQPPLTPAFQAWYLTDS